MVTRTAALRLQLQDLVSGPAGKTTGALSALDRSIGKLGAKGVPGAKRLIGDLEHLRSKAATVGQFAELRRGTAAAFGEFRTARSRVDELRRSLETVAAPTGKMRAGLRSAESAMQRASNAFREQRNATSGAANALRTFGLNTRTAANAQRDIRNQMAQTIRKMREMDREARKARQASPGGAGGRFGGAGSMGAGAVGTYYAARQLAGPTGKALTYDQTLTYVASTLAAGGNLREKLAAKSRVSDAVNASLLAGGGTRDDAAAALNRMVASGAFEGDEALTTLGSVTKTAHAAGASADDIAGLAVALKNNGVQPGQMMAGFDAALRAGQLGGVELRDLARWLPQQMALARGSGLTGLPGLEWLAAANQTSLSTAGGPDEAANNLTNLLQKLNSRELATTIGKTAGVDWQAYMLERQKAGVAPPEAFAEILDRQLAANAEYQNLQAGIADAKTPEDRRALLERAAMVAEASEVGRLIADRQALMAAIALRNGRERQRAIEAELQGSAGTVDAESEFVRSQTWSKIQDSKNVVDRAGEQTYDAVSGPLGSLADKVNETATAFPTVTTAVYGFGSALAALAAGGTVGAIAGGIIGGRGIKGLRGVFGRRSGAPAPQRIAPPGSAAGALKGVVGRGVALGLATYAGEKVIDVAANGVADRLYTPEQRKRADEKLKNEGIWSRRFWLGDAVDPGVSFRDRLAIRTGTKDRSSQDTDPNMAAEAARASVVSKPNSEKAGDTNINAPMSAPVTVNQTFNGVTLEQSIAAARQAAKEAAEAVLNTFLGKLNAQLRRSSEIQHGGISAYGDK